MNINLWNRNVDVLNCSLFYRLFYCSYLKSGAKHSQVFVESRGTKFYSRKITGCQNVSFRESGFLLGNFFPLLMRGLLFDLCIQLFEVYIITFDDGPQSVCKPSVFFAITTICRIGHLLVLIESAPIQSLL